MHFTNLALTILPLFMTSTFAAPTITARTGGYTPGWCTFHLELWVPDSFEYTLGNKRYKVRLDNLLDGKGISIAGDSNPKSAQAVSGATASFSSPLPLFLEVASTDITGKDGVLNFKYGDEFWTSDNPQCGKGLGASTGEWFEGSYAQLDCGFTCN